MAIAITRLPSRAITNCALTYIERITIDYDRAVQQHAAYRDALKACGMEVVTLPPAEDLADSVFVEDTAIILDEIAIITPLGIESRRPEAALNEPEIARYRPTIHIELPATIEGGDVLRVGKSIYVSPSTRTNQAGIEALRQLAAPYGYSVTAVTLRDCLHLKSGCTALDDETILVHQPSIDTSVFKGYRLLDVAEGENGAANVVRANETILLNSQYPATAERIAQQGYAVCAVDTSEFTKAEAAMTCMSLIVN